MKSKAIQNLNRYLNSWLKQNSFSCTVNYSSDFSYDPLNEVIDYSFIVVQDHDRLFIELCKQIRPEIIKCDTFILSFFHELGHYVTTDDFTEQEYEDYIELDKKLNLIEHKSDEQYLQYYLHPVEYEATKWACNYIVDNAKSIQKLYKRVQKYELAYLKELEMLDCETQK